MECEMTYQEVFMRQFMNMMGNFTAFAISVGIGYPLVNFYRKRLVKIQYEDDEGIDTTTLDSDKTETDK
jgi:hypothetical protein